MMFPALSPVKSHGVQPATWQTAVESLPPSGRESFTSSHGHVSALCLGLCAGASVAPIPRRSASRRARADPVEKAGEEPAPGLRSGWREVQGCPVFVPSSLQTSEMRCLHFLGGAFVGASPKLFYSDFMEALAEDCGAVVVATPYKLTFDYDAMASETAAKYDQVVARLSEEDPSIKDCASAAVGHSCGALLHTLLVVAEGRHESCVLMAFNNKPVSDAIPVPLPPPPEDPRLRERLRNGVEGALSDGPVQEALAAAERAIRAAGAAAPSEDFSQRTAPVLSQWGPLLGSVVEGQTEFTLSTDDISSRILTDFPSTRTLVVQFANDFTDETDRLAGLIRKAGGQVDKLRFPGGHTTPLDAPLGSSRIRRLSESISAFVLGRAAPGQAAAQEELSRLKLGVKIGICSAAELRT